MANVETGELVDPAAHVAELRGSGLPFVNRGMATLAKILVFISRCDGTDHPSEWSAIEEGLTKYALRFGGDDSDLEQAIAKTRSVAPDCKDFANSLHAIVRTPAAYKQQLARLILESCAAVIDADGYHTAEEHAWGASIGTAMKIIAAPPQRQSVSVSRNAFIVG